MALFALSRTGLVLKTLGSSSVPCGRPVRSFWAWLNSVTNQVDPDRIKEVGPDRACAEWLLRCGAAVKWEGKGSWEKDYNQLPGSNFQQYKIQEIDATSSTIMALGFPHLKGLKHVRRIVLHDCRYLYDEALDYLSLVKDTLLYLQLSNCGDITDSGLVPLKQLVNLRELVMFQLPEVRDPKRAESMLKSALPNCDVRFTEFRPGKEDDNSQSKHT
ncbi:ATP synthase subunit s, mitochondrial-like [Babylonia areolata]|uniref:ATP synthase subunit s, mitochondrial-like n=1 Tax=Babylonia areolata TaxID=304850 RepID=UPI003FD2525A